MESNRLAAETAARDQLGEAEREARAAADAATQERDEFLATLAHELRTPLNAIGLWARLLRSEHLDAATAQRGLDIIEENVRIQNRLITDLLDVSRITAGTFRLDSRFIDLVHLVETTVDALRPTVDAKGLSIAMRLDSGMSLVGDPDRLQRMLEHVLANAVKFTEQGGRIEVALARAGDRARLTVSNSGRGISPDVPPDVSETSRRADAEDRREPTRLGLGLWIIHRIAELHGGDVTASRPGHGQGAVFTVDLPLIPPGLVPSGPARTADRPVVEERDGRRRE